MDEPEALIVLERDEVMAHVLPRRQLWFVSAVAYDCEEHQVSNTTISKLCYIVMRVHIKITCM